MDQFDAQHLIRKYKHQLMLQLQCRGLKNNSCVDAHGMVIINNNKPSKLNSTIHNQAIPSLAPHFLRDDNITSHSRFLKNHLHAIRSTQNVLPRTSKQLSNVRNATNMKSYDSNPLKKRKLLIESNSSSKERDENAHMPLCIVESRLDDCDASSTVAPSSIGLKFYEDNDVLCGRGGGTNVHSGNRYFRILINVNRRNYLCARKNDKPGISRSIVRDIRKRKGRFLKKDAGSGLWFDIGDNAAREKTSQALRQRASDYRKVILCQNSSIDSQISTETPTPERAQSLQMISSPTRHFHDFSNKPLYGNGTQQSLITYPPTSKII